MKNVCLAHVCLVIVCSTLLATPLAPAAGQPILNRVEQLLRDQIDSAVQQESAKAGKPAEPGYLGMLGDDSTPSGLGISVLEIYPGQAAAGAGLRPGDLITRIGDREVRSMDNLAAVLAEQRPGAKLTFTVQRDGVSKDLSVTLGRRPPESGSIVNELPSPDPTVAPPASPPPSSSGAPSRPRLGVRTVPVTADVQRQHQLPQASGAQVVSVAIDSPAAKAGIPLGSVITGFDGLPVRSPEDLAAAVRAADKREVPLTFVTVGRTQKVTIDLGTLVLSPSAPAPGPQLETRARPPQPAPQTPPPPAAQPPVPEFPIPDAVPASSPHEASDTQAEQESRLADRLREGVPDAASRIEALERQVAELEARIKSLEAKLTQDEAPK
jgi:membrane-associated protease RseP (regulator of RpoE activity)